MDVKIRMKASQQNDSWTANIYLSAPVKQIIHMTLSDHSERGTTRAHRSMGTILLSLPTYTLEIRMFSIVIIV